MRPSDRPYTPRLRVCLPEPTSPPSQGIGLRLKSSTSGLPPRYSTVGLRKPRSPSESSDSDAHSNSSEEDGGNAGLTPPARARRKALEEYAGAAGMTPTARMRPNPSFDICSSPGSESEAALSVSPPSVFAETPPRRRLPTRPRRNTPAAAAMQHVAASVPEYSDEYGCGIRRKDQPAALLPIASRRSPGTALTDMTNVDTETDASCSPLKRRSSDWLSSASDSPSKRVHLGLSSSPQVKMLFSDGIESCLGRSYTTPL